jgi:hypothetical protein
MACVILPRWLLGARSNCLLSLYVCVCLVLLQHNSWPDCKQPWWNRDVRLHPDSRSDPRAVAAEKDAGLSHLQKTLEASSLQR